MNSLLFFLLAACICCAEGSQVVHATVCTIPDQRGSNGITVQILDTSTTVFSQQQQQIASFPNGHAMTLLDINWDVTAVDGNQKITQKIRNSQQLWVQSVVQNSPDECLIMLTCGESCGGGAISITASSTAEPLPGQFVAFSIIMFSSSMPVVNALKLHLNNVPHDESIIGMGEQYNTLDLRGTKSVRNSGIWPVFTREQGVGRGSQPLTWLLNHFGPYLGGSPRTNYASRPQFFSHRGSLVYEHGNAEYSEFDFSDSAVAEVSILINSTRSGALTGHVGRASSGKAAVAALMSLTAGGALPRAPPAWSYSGAIIGMQGDGITGSEAVRSNWTALKALGGASWVKAFWLQDWTGPRPLAGRVGVAWCWGQWSSTHYPNHTEMIQDLQKDNVKVLVYQNPMLIDSSGLPGLGENPWLTAWQRGYFVRRNGQGTAPFVLYNNASMIDFSNPEAREFYINLTMRSFNTGTYGMMIDFGEALPLDANLSAYSSSTPAAAHNEYPDRYLSAAREAADRLGAAKGKEIFFFARSAWRRTSTYVQSWSGDQLSDWDIFDGIGSAAASLVTSGLSGTPFQHSDIGGYNSFSAAGVPLIRRTEELFLRWCELAAFSVFFRTHDGSDPSSAWQFYSSQRTREQFARYAGIFVAWLPLRSQLVRAAAVTAIPIVRPLLLELQDEVMNVSCPWPTSADSNGLTPSTPVCNNVRDSYFIGGMNEGLLVAPVLTKGATTATVVFPPGFAGVHVWSNRTVEGGGQICDVAAPVGCPAVFLSNKAPLFNTLKRNFNSLSGVCATTSGFMSNCKPLSKF